MQFAKAAEAGLAPSVGMGGVSQASLSELGTILTAPAALALAPRYEVGLGGRLGSDRVRRYEAAAMDSSTGPLALGLMFIRESSEQEATTDQLPGWLEPGAETTNPAAETTVGGGLALSWLNRHLAAGIGVRYVRSESRFTDIEQKLQWDASFAGRIGEQVILSATARDLVPWDGAAFAPGAGLGARWQMEKLAALEVDANAGWDGAPLLQDLRVGGEAVAAQTVPLRLGYRRDLPKEADFLTAGIGLAGEQAELAYGAEVQLGALAHEHSLSLQLFF